MRSRSRGTMLWMALVLLAIIGVVIAATAGVVQSDARRTRDEVSGAQLRQLLQAGQSAATEELARTTSLKAGSLKLPAEIGDASVSIRPEAGGPDLHVRVEARIGNTKAAQTLTYKHTFVTERGEYTLIDARLD